MRVAIALLIGAVTACADAATDVADQARGCVECHSPANTRGSLPLLEGQNAEYLAAQLAQFREQHRDAFPMSTIAADLDDAAMRRLAAHFAAQPWLAFPISVDSERVRDGAATADRFACANCHGEAYTGNAVVPRLAGQNPIYIERELRLFGAGERYHPPTGTGARMRDLGESERGALARFLAALGPAADGKGAAPDAPLDFDWLAGHWCGDTGGTSVEEHWTAPAGGMTLGVHREIRAGKAVAFEFMRIEYADNQAVLHAQPGGVPPTAFRLVERTAAGVVFANPEHDYPKRVFYERRDGHTLRAGIDGGAGTAATTWTWDDRCRQ